ncbi:uncharacterized protein [Zea mays]|uniref:RNA binding (RRM/RBD/RNP motifs) family protein n=1 Tax=Zea mays TaxID=4577 RepID=A0A1D6MG78_MAIZE|nr:uncharacterized protein LOC103649602 [Zea mays]ONM28562.1 RNA binding (RRM/RBD/RNP motifs) family protein [Zea mays]|eukprot:XP_008673561.1 uncharacterized protein LOC103649602 [Zea mays]
MNDQTNEKCPLCLNKMDLTDKQLKPCKCGYEICLWCWHRIIDESGGRCPGCRSVYNKDKILETSARNQILKELCADKSNYQKEQVKSHKQTSAKVQLGQSEPKDPNSIRVIQRKLVYIVGMPTEFASEKLLRQKSFLGQYGKIENIIIDNVGANQQVPDSGRVYVTFAKEVEAIRCIQAVDGYSLDGRPLKATFGVTRYCHIWLSNKDCYKPNCSYVHYKAPAEEICTKDDVSVVCARLQHSMGMSTKCLQHRSGRTLPPPCDCSSRNTTASGISKDICINDDRLLPNGAIKYTSLPSVTTPRDSSLSSGSPPSPASIVLHQRNDHERLHNNQQNLSDLKPQRYIPPGGRNCSSEMTTSVKHMQPIEGAWLHSSSNEHLGSNNDKSQASSQLGNDNSNPKQITSAENGTSDTVQQKPQYADVVSQGQVAPVRRLTVLNRPSIASSDTRPKATGQVVNGTSTSFTKLTLVQKAQGSCITIPRNHPVPQIPEEPAHLFASASVKSHAGVEIMNECSDIKEKIVLGGYKQLPESTVSHRLTASQNMSSGTLPSNLSASYAKTQGSAGSHNLSDLNMKLVAKNRSQLVNQQNAPVSVSNTGIARASFCCSTLNKNASLSDGDSSHNRRWDTIRSGHIVSSHSSDSTMLSRPASAVSSTDVASLHRKERRQACPPGFEKPHLYSGSGKACSGHCSAPDALVQDCGIPDQQDFTSLTTDCLKDDGDVTQNLSMNISSPPSLTDTNRNWSQSHRQFPGTLFGWSNDPQYSFYPGGSSHPRQEAENWDGTSTSYMATATGGYKVFSQGTTSDMRGGMAGTLLQQPIMSTHDRWTDGSSDSGRNCPQVDISYRMYSLF